MTHREIIRTLNHLIETCKDATHGFAACAKHTLWGDLRSRMLLRASECETAAAELEWHVRQYGGTPYQTGTASRVLHCGWVAVRGALSGFTDEAMLDECECEEDAVLFRYCKVLKQGRLPALLLAVVRRQERRLQHMHHQTQGLLARLARTNQAQVGSPQGGRAK